VKTQLRHSLDTVRENGRLSRSDDPFFRIPHVLNGLEPPIRPHLAAKGRLRSRVEKTDPLPTATGTS
jgi:hypothetical protein